MHVEVEFYFQNIILFVENRSCNQHLHHLIGSFQNLINSDISEELFNWVVFQITISSMHL